jgi:DNA-binding XRE family transcriptional regulator
MTGSATMRHRIFVRGHEELPGKTTKPARESPLTRTRRALQAFGRQLGAIRTEANISQGELSRRSKVGRQSISEIDLGRENPSLETIVLLADGLRCELSDFPRTSTRRVSGLHQARTTSLPRARELQRLT